MARFLTLMRVSTSSSRDDYFTNVLLIAPFIHASDGAICNHSKSTTRHVRSKRTKEVKYEEHHQNSIKKPIYSRLEYVISEIAIVELLELIALESKLWI